MAESRLLDQNHDPGLKTGEHTTAELELEEATRLATLGMMATIAGSIPRRVGGEATKEELSRDKKTCRRVSYIALKCEGMWLPDNVAVTSDDELRRQGAQVIWNSWWSTHQEFLHHRMRYISTWALRNDEIKWGNHAVTNLRSERKWLDMILN